MRLSKILATIAIVTCFTATTAFAAPETLAPNNTPSTGQVIDKEKGCKGKSHKWDKESREEFLKDPVKALKARKEKIQALYKEGKITKEKADAITARLDSKIKEINEFNKLSLKEKKEKLKENFRKHLERKVADGRITREKMDNILKKYNEKLEEWDGSGYPMFFEKGSWKSK